VGQRDEGNIALSQPAQHAPVEHKAGGGRFERSWIAGDCCPDVPHLERRRHVRVLNRTTVTRDSCPHDVGRAFEMKRHQTRMTQHADYGRHQRTQHQAVTGQQRRR